MTLGYVAQMQEAGVPVTYGYISDAHDNHQNAFPAPPDPNGVFPRASGPGESDYVQTLHEYDQAFATFFARLQPRRDHEAEHALRAHGRRERPLRGRQLERRHVEPQVLQRRRGPAVPCESDRRGEREPALADPEWGTELLRAQRLGTDGLRERRTRRGPMQRSASSSVTSPRRRRSTRTKSGSATPVALYLADKVGEKTLHMVTADQQRTPSFTLFGNPDYFLTAGKTSAGAPSKFNCPDSAHQAFVCIDYHFAWSHGDATEDIGRTWLGMAGPGVKHLGMTSAVWSDHTDIQPTIMSLLEPQGQLPAGRAGPTSSWTATATRTGPDLTELGSIYKQINAPFGQLSFDVLAASTRALSSGSSTDYSTYTAVGTALQR